MRWTAEDRLREWSECAGLPFNGYPDHSPLARLMREGAGAATGGKSTGGPVPRLVDQQGALIAQQARCREVARMVDLMPDTWRQVVRIEWLEGNGYRAAKTELGWNEREWIRQRSGMLGWLSAHLNVAPCTLDNQRGNRHD